MAIASHRRSRPRRPRPGGASCPRCGKWSPRDHEAFWCLGCGTWGEEGWRATDAVAPAGRATRGTFRPWSPSEDAYLVAKLGSGMPVSEIAQHLNRTERAVWSRLSIKGWSRRGRTLTNTAKEGISA